MIGEVLAVALKAGIVTETARRVFWWVATASALVALAVGIAILAVSFAGASAYFALADAVSPAAAAAVVALCLFSIAGAIVAVIWFRMRPRPGRGLPSAGLAATGNGLQLALLALGAGMAAGSTMFGRRDR